jgi:hypothetical protein
MFVDERLGFHVGVYYNTACRVVSKPNIDRGFNLGSDSNLMMACENRDVRRKRISLK